MTTRNDKPMLFIEELWRNGPVPQEPNDPQEPLREYGIGKDRADFKYQIWMKPPNDHPISLGIYELFWEAQQQMVLISEVTGFLCGSSLFMSEKLHKLNLDDPRPERPHATAERVATLVAIREEWKP